MSLERPVLAGRVGHSYRGLRGVSRSCFKNVLTEGRGGVGVCVSVGCGVVVRSRAAVLVLLRGVDFVVIVGGCGGCGGGVFAVVIPWHLLLLLLDLFFWFL